MCTYNVHFAHKDSSSEGIVILPTQVIIYFSFNVFPHLSLFSSFFFSSPNKLTYYLESQIISTVTILDCRHCSYNRQVYIHTHLRNRRQRYYHLAHNLHVDYYYCTSCNIMQRHEINAPSHSFNVTA